MKYVSFDTQSDGESVSTPSASKQFKLAEFLLDELHEMGIEKAILTDKCYIYASIPASKGFEDVPAIGFISHLDTSDAASGADVKYQIIPEWDGKPIMLGNS